MKANENEDDDIQANAAFILQYEQIFRHHSREREGEQERERHTEQNGFQLPLCTKCAPISSLILTFNAE